MCRKILELPLRIWNMKILPLIILWVRIFVQFLFQNTDFSFKGLNNELTTSFLQCLIKRKYLNLTRFCKLCPPQILKVMILWRTLNNLGLLTWYFQKNHPLRFNIKIQMLIWKTTLICQTSRRVKNSLKKLKELIPREKRKSTTKLQARKKRQTKRTNLLVRLSSTPLLRKILVELYLKLNWTTSMSQILPAFLRQWWAWGVVRLWKVEPLLMF